MCETATGVRLPALPVRVDQLIGGGDPDRPAVTFKSETLTYGDLADRVARVASGLHALGIRRGDRVAVYAEKRIETVVALLAVGSAGAVFVPVNPLFKTRHLGYVVDDCTPRAVITTAERWESVRAALTPDTSVEHVVLVGATNVERHTGDRWQVHVWDTLAESEVTSIPDRAAVIDQDVAAILYTSGSTGGPKGVVLSHRNIIAGAASVAEYLGHTQDDVVLAVLPLSFDAGFSQLTTSLIAGAHVVLVNYLRPKEVIRLCARHQVTGLTCVPPLWLQLVAQEWPNEATTRLRYFANTGGRLPRATLAVLRQRFPAALPFLMYGLTEAFRSTYLDPAQADLRPDSIGKAIPNAEILVVRPDGSPCDPGEHGELVHRGALVALGYWNDPERTAERFRPVQGANRFTRTEIAVWSGDTAYRDDEGFLYFVGRTDDMIKTSGYRVSPTEIEEAAYATGLVGEAVALGVVDGQLGHHIVLVVTLNDAGQPGHTQPEDVQPEYTQPADILSRALGRELPTYMLPRRIEVLADLPRSVNGKFDRVALREAVQRTPEPSGVK